MSVDQIVKLFEEGERLVQQGKHLAAQDPLTSVLEQTQPIFRIETEDEIIEPFQAVPTQFDEAEASTGGKPVRLVMDYFTAAVYYLGYCKLEEGDHATAVTYLEEAVGLWPRNPRVRLELTTAYIRMSRLSDALANLQEGLELDEDAELYRELCWVRNAMGNHEKAAEAGERAVELAPDSKAAFEELLFAYQELGEDRKAVTLLERFPED